LELDWVIWVGTGLGHLGYFLSGSGGSIDEE